MPFSRLIQILVTNKMAFLKPEVWDDPWENFLFQQTIVDPESKTDFKKNKK